jgi:NAD(P)-dependent dehydrogenase (short-subunit alcohol dehydrogenase family)
MNPFELTNKTILVTGASSGIGRAAAVRISELGGKVILSGRNAGALKDTLNLLKGPGHRIVVADLTIEKEREILINELKVLDGIVHSAGVVKPFPVKFISEKQVDEMHRINYLAPVLLTGQLLKQKKVAKGGSMVFLSSISSEFPHKGGAIYSGTKAALNAYCKVVALEYAHQHIRANYINAAMVKTPLFDEVVAEIGEEVMHEHGKRYPLGFGQAEDVANGIVFLLSDASKWITGTGIVMDGGLTIG